jgi:catechol 2,3-dioxygenase-like lactoylglutathione lyase family enzyme
MRIERVDFVDIPSRDVDRAVAFYRDVLELPQNPREPTEFEAGNVTLAIWRPEAQGVELESGASSSATGTPGSATWRSSRIPTVTR